MIALALSALALALGGVSLVLELGAPGRLLEIRAGLRRLAAAALERQGNQLRTDRLRQVQETAEKGVDFGATTVRAVHRGIAGIPFGILEAIPATRDTARLVRSAHDQISDAVYGGIAGANRVIGAALRQALPKDKDDDEDKGEPG